MNVSRNEQRVLNALAHGGRILHYRNEKGRIDQIACVTAEGWRLSLCTLELFQLMRRRRLIASKGGGPYLITKLGLQALSAFERSR